MIADEKRDDADKVDFESDFESNGTVSVVCAFLHCYTQPLILCWRVAPLMIGVAVPC